MTYLVETYTPDAAIMERLSTVMKELHYDVVKQTGVPNDVAVHVVAAVLRSVSSVLTGEQEETGDDDSEPRTH